MRHYLWIPILCLLTCGCSKEPSPETGPGQLHSLRVAFVAEEPRTRSLSDGEERRIDDLNVWIYDTGHDFSKHLYLTGTDRLQLELTAGEYECFVVANQGVSVGGLPYERMETLGTNTGTEAKLTEKGRLVMSARAILRTGAGTQTVSLRRVVAKVRMRIVLGTSLDPRTVIDRISLGNHPNLVALFGDNKLKPYQGTCVYPGRTGIGSRDFTAEFYVPENLQGQVSSVTSEAQRNERNAPSGASYVVIGTRNDYYGRRMDYRVYLGTGDPSDFNVPRNTILDYAVNILGENTSDLRVMVSAN